MVVCHLLAKDAQMKMRVFFLVSIGYNLNIININKVSRVFQVFDLRNIVIPVRITENKYVKSSLEDAVHFGKLMYYTKIESEGIGDDSEDKIFGKSKKDNTTITIKDPRNDKEWVISSKDLTQDPKIEYNLVDEIKEKVGVACFSLLTFEDFESFSFSKNQEHFKLKAKVLDDIKRYIQEKEKYTGNECSLIVYSCQNFFESIRNAGYEADKIKYYEPYDLSKFIEIKNGNKPYYYFKPANYKYQREYRIVKINKKDFPENGEILTINGISKEAAIISSNQLNRLELVIDTNN